MSSLPRVAVSACLLGQTVRWDGAEKRSEPTLALRAAGCELVPVCPEVELGLGVPREPIELQRTGGAPALRGVHSGTDHSEGMDGLARERLEALRARGLDGWVFKSRSPSCGLVGVPIHDRTGGTPAGAGAGAFSRRVMSDAPALPLIEEIALDDPAALRRFLDAVRAHHARRLEQLR